MVQTKLKETFIKINDYAQNPLGDQRVIDHFPVGCHARQGDVYVIRLNKFDASTSKLTSERQLAPGTSAGSRHTVSDAVNVYITPDNLKCLKVDLGFKVMGPVVEAKERWTVMHPEHADISMPAGIYQICYQTDPNTLSRVLD